MTRTATTRLATYQRSYRELAERVPDIGFIADGTITYRHNRCGKPNCRCHGDPAQLHGPYYQWTAKVDGKTVTKRLTPAEAELHQEWIGNDRQLRAMIAQMREVAAKATALILQGPVPRLRSARSRSTLVETPVCGEALRADAGVGPASTMDRVVVGGSLDRVFDRYVRVFFRIGRMARVGAL